MGVRLPALPMVLSIVWFSGTTLLCGHTPGDKGLCHVISGQLNACTNSGTTVNRTP